MREVSKIEQQTLELLDHARKAAQLDIEEHARGIHEQSVAADEGLEWIQTLGAQAVGLYETFEQRETYFMGSEQPTLGERVRAGLSLLGKSYSARDLAHARQVTQYAQHIVRSRDGDITFDRAWVWAEDELGRRSLTEASNRAHEDFADDIDLFCGTGPEGLTGKYTTVISASGYEYYSPPLFPSQGESTSEGYITQQWRVKAALPCTMNGFKKVIITQHEQRLAGKRLVTPLHSMIIESNNTVSEVIDVSKSPAVTLSGKDLAFPHGLLTAATDAVITSVPDKLSKQW